MLSYDERSIYVFFSYTFDFIGKCSLGGSPNITDVAANSSVPAYTIPASECTYLSPKAFVPASASDAGITGAPFTLKGCVRMTPTHYLACLYDMRGAKAMLYAVDKHRDGGPQTVLDTYYLAYSATGENVGRPKSPPAWDPSTKRLYYMIDLNSANCMGLRYVHVNAMTTSGGGSQPWATVYGTSSLGILWRGLGSDSSNYHSFVFMRGTSASARGAAYTSTLVAACTPPMCAEQLSFVSFTGSFSQPVERTTMVFPGSSLVRDLGVRWAPPANSDPASGAVFVGQQRYVLSKSDRMWGLWTQCAACPLNSFSAAGSTTSTLGINACKCSDNYYGILSLSVIDQCVACRTDAWYLAALNICVWIWRKRSMTLTRIHTLGGRFPRSWQFLSTAEIRAVPQYALRSSSECVQL